VLLTFIIPTSRRAVKGGAEGKEILGFSWGNAWNLCRVFLDNYGKYAIM